MLVQTGPLGIDERDDGTADRADPDPESHLANSVLVVGDAGMASARSLAQLGYDVRLAQLGADERLEIVWRSDEQGVTIELEIVDTLLMASTRWREIGEVVADSENRPDAFARLQAAFDLSEVGANFVLDMNMGSLTRLALQELRTERAHLDDALGSGSGE